MWFTVFKSYSYFVAFNSLICPFIFYNLKIIFRILIRIPANIFERIHHTCIISFRLSQTGYTVGANLTISDISFEALVRLLKHHSQIPTLELKTLFKHISSLLPKYCVGIWNVCLITLISIYHLLFTCTIFNYFLATWSYRYVVLLFLQT